LNLELHDALKIFAVGTLRHQSRMTCLLDFAEDEFQNGCLLSFQGQAFNHSDGMPFKNYHSSSGFGYAEDEFLKLKLQV
jgi:hypothetical protein